MTAADGHSPAPSAEHTDLVQIRARKRTDRVERASKRLRLQWAYDVARLGHDDYERPQTRGDCLPGGCNGARPCPWVSCVHHLATDVHPTTGSVTWRWGDDADDLDSAAWRGDTCALDVADRGGLSLDAVGHAMNLTRERTRQLETLALTQLRAALIASGMTAAEAAGVLADAVQRGGNAPTVTEETAQGLRAVRLSHPSPGSRVAWRAPRPADPALATDPEYLRLVASNARALDPRAARRPGVALCGPALPSRSSRYADAPEALPAPSRHPCDELSAEVTEAEEVLP